VLYVSLSTWDTQNDAREFFNAYVKRTELRYAGATSTGTTADSQSLAALKSFRTAEGMVVIELRGNRVIVLEGLPDGANSRSLLKAL
jgi:hypothetical protein